MAAGLRTSARGRAPGGCGALVAIPFFAVFLAAGLFFEGLIAREFLRTLRTYSWERVECAIESSRVLDQNEQGQPTSEFQIEIEYTYSLKGQSYTSRQFALQPKSYSDYGEAQRLVLRYAAGSKAPCFVNPSDPAQAVLQRGSLWSGFALLFPLIFVAIGGGGIFFSVRGLIRRRTPELESAPARPKALSERGGAAGRRVLVLFFGVFLAVGLAVSYFMTLRPLWGVLAARAWQKTPCTVLASSVRSHSSDDGTTYSINILYSYEVAGREYKANRHSFMGGSSSGHDRKAAVVRRYPPGLKTFCYVDPRDPTEAVLDRGITGSFWWGLFPLIFVAVGGGGIVFALRQGWNSQGRSNQAASGSGNAGSASPLAPQTSPAEAPASVVLRPGAARLGKLAGAILVACFWNGIVSVFVAQAVQSWMRHKPEWFLMIFLIPFVAVGLVMVGFVIRCFLELFNPRPIVTLAPGAVRIGGTADVRWRLEGRAHVLRRLTLRIEGREEAQYRRGTNTVTDRSVFAAYELANATDRAAIRSGQARLTLPAGLMHSWAAPNNKIVWSLKVTGEIAWWPDLQQEYPLTVLPQPAPASETP